MTLREVLDNIRKSNVFQLKSNNTLLGYRVKLFNTETLVFNYYDFSIETVSILPNLNDCPIVELIQKDGYWASEAEISGKISVLTCEDKTQISKILNRVKIIMDYNREEAETYEV